MRREWKHRTRVWYDGIAWRWDCCICTWRVTPLKYATQPDAFQAASNHASLGGYRTVE